MAGLTAEAMASAIAHYLRTSQRVSPHSPERLAEHKSFQDRLLESDEEAREVAAAELLRAACEPRESSSIGDIGEFLRQLLKRGNPSRPSTVAYCLNVLRTRELMFQPGYGLGDVLLRVVLRAEERHPLSAELKSNAVSAATFIEDYVRGHYRPADALRAAKSLRRLGGVLPREGQFDPGEPWSDEILREIGALDPETRAALLRLTTHAYSASGSAPSAKWMKRASELVAGVPSPGVAPSLSRWLPLVRQGSAREIGDDNASILKGLAWISTLEPNGGLAAAVADLCETCLRKIANVGARSAKVANACLWALSAMPGRDAIAQLGRLQLKAKYATAKKLIGRALDAAAKREGMTRQDLEEIVVPSFGLGADGALRQPLGAFTAEIRIAGTTEAELRFVAADGKVPKAVPAAVKKEHAEELKALKRTQKDIESMLPAQRDRLERLLFGGRSWTPADWRERFLEPPLISGMVKRLIWSADGVPAFWRDGGLVDAEDRPVPSPAKVELWHPITSPADTVLAWRRFLQRHEVTQPFKQAHREIYAVTPAEIATSTYSNRFAAHILRQHQFAALCQQRGWTYRLFGGFDSGGTPTLELPDHNLVAEFWVEGLGETLSQNGICVYISTDQVRFYNSAREQLRIEAVPPRLFSEVMRNVDLFVGVCSIGGDPAWLDRGERREYDAYWRDTSFGELTATAQSRSEVLSGLLPRLKIRERSRIEGRFLVVKGDLRTYKIHLGSANILMEPNDQYLCIVPDRSPRGAGDKVFLPFEGDSTLSVILSKAFLLADDAKIRDETILRQLKK